MCYNTSRKGSTRNRSVYLGFKKKQKTKENKQKQDSQGFPGCPVLKTALPRQRVQVWSLVGELRSHVLNSWPIEEISNQKAPCVYSANLLLQVVDCTILLPQGITEYEHIGSWSGYRFHWNTHSLPQVNILCLTCVNEEREIKAEMLTTCPALLWLLRFSSFSSHHLTLQPPCLLSVPKSFLFSSTERPLQSSCPPPLAEMFFLFSHYFFFFNKVTPNHPSDLISYTMSTGTHSLTAVIMENLH